MGVTQIRPTSDYADSGTTYIGGGSLSDNNDGTYRIFYAGAYTECNMGDIGALAGNQRILQVRPIVRMDRYNGAFTIDTHLYQTDGSGNYQDCAYIGGSGGGVFTVWGNYQQSSPSGTEWTVGQVNALRVKVQDFGGGSTSPEIMELYADVDIRTQPTISGVGPTGTNPGATRTPTASWSFSDPDGLQGQLGYHVKVFTSAQGNPDVGGATYDSGDLVGGGNSHTITTSLADGTYYLYVKVSKDFRGGHWWSGWGSSSFVINDTPSTPTSPSPSNASTITTSKPTLGGTVVASPLSTPGRLEWNLATDNAFSVNTRTITEAVGDSTVSGAHTEVWPGATARLAQQSPNLLTVNQASVETDTTGFFAKLNCTISRITTQAAVGAASLQLSSTAAGAMQAQLAASGAKTVPVLPSTSYTAMGSFKTAVSARSCRLVIDWYNAAGGLISSSTGTSITDATASWTVASVTATSPATAVSAVVYAEVLATGGAAELHYTDRFQWAVGSNTTWELPGAYTWYLRMRTIDNTGKTGPYTSTISFTVSHPPAPANLTPTGDLTLNYGSGAVTFDWDFTDPDAADTQSAFQVIVERNDTSANVTDSGKVATNSTTTAWTFTIPVGQKDQPLRWKVRLWDSDDVVGSYSTNQLFRVADQPQVVITYPADNAIVDNARPTFTWTDTLTGGRTQASYRVRVQEVGATLGTTYDSGTLSGTNLTHQPAANILQNGKAYTVEVDCTDSTGLTGTDTNAFICVFDQPRAVVPIINVDSYDDFGYATVTWTNSVQDAQFTQYQLYRRKYGDTSWTKVGDPITAIQASYVVKDQLAAAGNVYEYTVAQTGTRYGVGIESPKPGEYRAPSVGFESGVAGWTLDGSGGSCTRITTDGAGGSTACVEIIDSSTTAVSLIKQTSIDDTPVTPGETITISVDVKPITSGTVPVLQFYFSDAANTQSFPLTGLTLNVWQTVVKSFVVPAGKTAGYALFAASDPAVLTQLGQVRVDNIKVYGTSLYVQPQSDRYWLIDPSNADNSVGLYNVTADTFSDEYEEAFLTVIGRGRKHDIGTRAGNTGTLSIQVRDIEGGPTARQQLVAIRALRDLKKTLYLRNPFGDIYKVAPGQISIDRMAGVGQREYATVTLPYQEIA